MGLRALPGTSEPYETEGNGLLDLTEDWASGMCSLLLVQPMADDGPLDRDNFRKLQDWSCAQIT